MKAAQVDVERAFVISLPFRRDRMASFKEQEKNVKGCLPEVEVWPAVHGDTCQPPRNWQAGAGAWGCYRSHMQILEYCLNNRVSSYVVFEDDAQIRPEFIDYVPAAFEELPEDWEQFYLGGQLMHAGSHPPIRVSDKIYRPFNVNRTHCYAVSRAGMLPLYQYCTELPFVGHDHIDHHLGRWHEDAANKVYCLSEWMVGQHGSGSNVSGKVEPVQFYDNANTLSLSHWLYETPVCVLFRGTQRQAKECLDFLHFGNTINSHGYDVTLHEASRYKYPGPTLSRWYSWISGEIAREGSDRLPAAFHPQIDEQALREHVADRVIVVEHFATPDEALAQIKEKFPEWNERKTK